MIQLQSTAEIWNRTDAENNDILTFAKYIRHGLSNGTDLQTLRDYSMWYWRNQIRPMFSEEEQIVIPFAGKHFYAEQLLKEHDDIRELVLILDKKPESSLFSILATFIEYHVQFKKLHFMKFMESIVFKMGGRTDELDTHQSTVSASEWRNAFWKKK